MQIESAFQSGMLSLSRTLAVALQAPGALAPCARLLATEAGAGPSSPHGPNSSASTDHSGGEAVGSSHQEPEWDPEHEREQALCREVLRSGLVAEVRLAARENSTLATAGASSVAPVTADALHLCCLLCLPCSRLFAR